MAGLHFSCGRWMGADKSANPLFDIFDEIEEVIGIADESWFNDFRDAIDFESEELELDLKPLAAIAGPMTEYKEMLMLQSGLSAEQLANFDIPDTVPVDLVDRLVCVQDFFTGFEHARKSSDPLVVCFA